jgi:hypothetical protein
MSESEHTRDAKSAYGEHVGMGGRFFAVIISLFLLGAPVFCFFEFFLVPGFFAGKSGTLAQIVGQTGSIVVAIVLLVMAKEFWPRGLKVLRDAFQKRAPSLHVFAEKGDKAGIEAQLAAGAAADSRDAHGNTALHLAAYSGHLPAVSALLAAGADKDARNKEGQTALYLAEARHHAEIVSALLAAGADKEGRDTPPFSASEQDAAETQSFALPGDVKLEMVSLPAGSF